MKKEALSVVDTLKLALEFVEANHSGGSDAFELITAIKEALAQPEPEPEPVMYQASSDGGKTWFQIELGPYYNTMDEYIKDLQAPNAVPVYLVRNLYTTPYVATPLPQRQCNIKPLTDEQIDFIAAGFAKWMFDPETRQRDCDRAVARAIEAAHGITKEDT